MSEGFIEKPGPTADGTGVWRRILILAAGALSLGLAACAPVDAPSGAGVAPPPVAVEHASGAAPNPERGRLMQAFGGEYHAPTTEAYLSGVLHRLATAPNGIRSILSRHRAEFACRQCFRPPFGGHIRHPRTSRAG